MSGIELYTMVRSSNSFLVYSKNKADAEASILYRLAISLVGYIKLQNSPVCCT